MSSNNALVMWTIYDHPTDHPDKFVARKWLIDNGEQQPTDELLAHKNLDTLRGMIWRVRPGLYCLRRQRDDDPVIVETWI